MKNPTVASDLFLCANPQSYQAATELEALPQNPWALASVTQSG